MPFSFSLPLSATRPVTIAAITIVAGTLCQHVGECLGMWAILGKMTSEVAHEAARCGGHSIGSLDCGRQSVALIGVEENSIEIHEGERMMGDKNIMERVIGAHP